jgi:pimeloyl-ACP methyl ester carboxylesterase
MWRFWSSQHPTADKPDADQAWQSINWSAHVHSAIIRGRRIRYADIGSGPAVVLIHGQGGCWQWWLRVIPTIAGHGRIIAVDLAGFGESEPIAANQDVFGEQVSTIVALLDHLGLAKSMIVGHSMGGLVSLQVASDFPRRVSGLLLVDAGGANISPDRLRWILAVLRIFNALFSIPWVPRVVAQTPPLRALFFAAGVHKWRTLSEPLARAILPRMAAPGFVQSLEAAAAAVNHVRPQDITCPCLVVWGARDRILPASTGRTLASKIPDGPFVALEAVGHCPMIETPDQFAGLLTDFLRDPLNGRPTADDVAVPNIRHRRRSPWWWPRRADSDTKAPPSHAEPLHRQPMELRAEEA